MSDSTPTESSVAALLEQRACWRRGEPVLGRAYRARQEGLNRLVALKMILSGAHAGEEEVARFRREAEAIARMQHPNVVQVFEVGDHDGRPYFSMELVEGGTLGQKTAGTPQPPR